LLDYLEARMRTAHQVPKELQQESRRTMRATVGLQSKPTDAERSRTLLRARPVGSLATQSQECPGFPFGSLVAYTVDERGNPILALSDIAEHSRNVAVDPSGSLMVSTVDAPPGGDDDPLALSRLTLLGPIVKLTGPERGIALELYREAFPDATYTSFGDFEMYRLEVASIRYVGGFGRMSWVSLEDYLAAEPDPVLPNVRGILEHMNADHTDALMLYCRAFSRVTDPVEVTLVGVDRYGMDIMTTSAGSEDKRAVRITFDTVLSSGDEVRMATIRLIRQAREKLGIPAPAPGAGH
jgi:putative heme iron utilization protein